MPVVVPSRKSLCRGRSTEARSIFGTVQQAIVHQLMNPLEARLFGFGRAVCSVDKRASNACAAFSGVPPGSSRTAHGDAKAVLEDAKEAKGRPSGSRLAPSVLSSPLGRRVIHRSGETAGVISAARAQGN